MTTILLCAPTRRSRWALCMLFFSTKKTEPKQMHVVGCYDRTREKFSRPLRDAVGRAIFFRSPFSYEKIYSVALLSPVSTWTAATGYFWFSLTDIPAWLCLFVCFIDLVAVVCDLAKFTIWLNKRIDIFVNLEQSEERLYFFCCCTCKKSNFTQFLDLCVKNK